MVFFLEVVLLRKLQFNKKKIKKNVKEGVGQPFRIYVIIFYCIPLLVKTIQP